MPGIFGRNLDEKKAPEGAFQDNCFYYDLLELVADTDDRCDLVRRRRRREAVDVRYSPLAGRISTRRVVIASVDVEVGTLRQEVVRTNHALVVLRVVHVIALRVVVSSAQQQSRRQLILEVQFGVVEFGAARRDLARSDYAGLSEILELRVAVRCPDGCRAERVSAASGNHLLRLVRCIYPLHLPTTHLPTRPLPRV